VNAIVSDPQPRVKGASSSRKKRATCADCGHRCYVEEHHEPPRCEGGTETVPLCHTCHIARHCRRSDFARWGQRGGKATAQNPLNWLPKLKQFRNVDWGTSLYVL
jgi:hypothetical protein